MLANTSVPWHVACGQVVNPQAVVLPMYCMLPHVPFSTCNRSHA